MKRIRFYTVMMITLVMAGAGVWFNTTQASEQIAGNEVVVKDRVVEEDLLATGNKVQILSEIKGDLTAAGTYVTVGEPVGGYMMGAGMNVDVNNSIGNDLWAAGSVVNVKGPIGDNAMLAGGTINLLPESSVKSDAILAGGTITVQGRIGRNLKVSGGDVKIGSEVAGNVEANTGRLTVLPGAVIRGNLNVTGPNPPDVSPQAQVLGKIDFHQREGEGGNPWLSWFYWWIYLFLALLLTGFAVLLLSDIWASRVARTMIEKPGYSLLAGFLGLLLVPLIIALLAIIFIGIPLALILLAIYGVFLLLSCVFAAYLVGGWLLGLTNRPPASPWLKMLVGALVVSFAASLPWIGWLVELAVLLFGFGALTLERWNLRQQLRSEGMA